MIQHHLSQEKIRKRVRVVQITNSSDLDGLAEVGHVNISRPSGIEDQPNLLVDVVLCEGQRWLDHCSENCSTRL